MVYLRKKFKNISSKSNVNFNKLSKATNKKLNKKAIKSVKNRKGFSRVIYLTLKIFICLTLLLIIGLSIVVTGLTVYVMKATDSQSDIKIDRDSIMSSSTTIVMAMDDESKKFIPINEVAAGPKRIWVDIQQIPKNLKNALVAVEDKNFYKHDGVDFKRTFVAFLNMFLHFWNNNQGGSTLTQQLLKNLTNDRAAHGVAGMNRKIREIYRAMNLERSFTKDQILQAYLNIASVGGKYGNYEGVGAASKLYFNKNVSDLNLTECVAITSIFRNPVFYDPIMNPENNRARREKTLNNMLKLGMITNEEFEEAINTPLKLNKGEISNPIINNYQNYFVDATLNQAVSDYMKLKNIDDWQNANDEFKKSGIKVYSTMNLDLQKKLEKFFQDSSNFGCSSFKNKPNAACAVFDLNGNMRACVGATGKKPSGDRVTTNYATSAIINPGSSFKPFIYAMAVNKNLINYSSIKSDSPIKKIKDNDWPKNFDKKYRGDVTVQYALEQSLNTVPIKLAQQLGVENICSFLINNLHFSTIYPPSNPYDSRTFESDAIAIGSLTRGVKLSELTNAYQIFGNGGYFTDLTTYEKMTNAAGESLFEPNRSSVKVIDSSTSAIMNRILRRVVTNGTGRLAELDAVEVVGKTGTSDNEKSLTFIGVTPNYIIGVWVGGKGLIKPAELFKKIATVVYKNSDENMVKKFDQLQEFVVQRRFCKQTGQLSNNSCPDTDIGFYNKNKLPPICEIHK